ncbi:hypothetical protein ACWGF3_28585 [Streptomyces xanthophaeus]|uniref:Uncharacterized protein n=1 Tax=Streptomyces xanthophaeus TaxID=67385 RepID=A0A919H2C8_9ACTN|nr:hypothetical protein [Streptomyces xanthophaeus]WST23096.1 hypothetical protein OG264_17310 [Streptomyces xanthophaeus]WST61928.1 hypothetical protein OG605_21125 [Streptomyces xanthophaeus]GHI89071.1 hypothetical protein Sxan_64350 [Streptomyces xanthophaeus]
MNVHRGVARALFALAAILAGAAVLAPLYHRPGGYALLAELDEPLVVGSLAALALAGAAGLSSRRKGLRTAAAHGLVWAVVLGASCVPVYLIATDPFPSVEYDVPAPDGVARRLVVERTSALTDPVWEVYVDDGSFPTARRWPVARFDELVPWPQGVRDAEWASPDVIRLIDFDHQPHLIELSPQGRPLSSLVW